LYRNSIFFLNFWTVEECSGRKYWIVRCLSHFPHKIAYLWGQIISSIAGKCLKSLTIQYLRPGQSIGECTRFAFARMICNKRTQSSCSVNKYRAHSCQADTARSSSILILLSQQSAYFRSFGGDNGNAVGQYWLFLYFRHLRAYNWLAMKFE